MNQKIQKKSAISEDPLSPNQLVSETLPCKSNKHLESLPY